MTEATSLDVTSIDTTVVSSIQKLYDNMATCRINVGGKIFTTRKATLAKSGYFRTLLEDDSTCDYSEHMIDRDPEIFAKLLNCMRDPRYMKDNMQKYMPELIYFDMLGLLPPKIDLKIEKVTPETRYGIDENGNIILYGYRSNVNLEKHPQLNIICTNLRLTIPSNHNGILESLINIPFVTTRLQSGYYTKLDLAVQINTSSIISYTIPEGPVGTKYSTRELVHIEGVPFAILRIIPITDK